MILYAFARNISDVGGRGDIAGATKGSKVQ